MSSSICVTDTCSPDVTSLMYARHVSVQVLNAAGSWHQLRLVLPKTVPTSSTGWSYRRGTDVRPLMKANYTPSSCSVAFSGTHTNFFFPLLWNKLLLWSCGSPWGHLCVSFWVMTYSFSNRTVTYYRNLSNRLYDLLWRFLGVVLLWECIVHTLVVQFSTDEFWHRICMSHPGLVAIIETTLAPFVG